MEWERKSLKRANSIFVWRFRCRRRLSRDHTKQRRQRQRESHKAKRSRPRPVRAYPFLLKNGDFFLRFGLRSARTKWRRSPKTHVSKRSPVWRCLKTPVYRFRVDGRKRRFSNTMISYFKQRMRCKTCYRTSIVLAFSCGRAETIRIRHSEVARESGSRWLSSAFWDHFEG